MAKKDSNRKPSERQIKLSTLKEETSISAIKKELKGAIDEVDERTLRNMYYNYQFLTMGAEPNRELKKALEVSIRQTEAQIIRREKMGMPTTAQNAELKEYKTKLASL